MKIDNEVYITKSNYNRLKGAYARLIVKIDEDMKSRIYKEDLSWIFSIHEMKHLFAESLVVLSGDGYSLKPGCMVQKNNSYLFDGGAPKYHFDKDCEYSTKSYTNFEIPPEIIERGKGEIEKCKKFASDNKALLYQDETKFLRKLEAVFRLQNPPKKVNYSNSGIDEFIRLTVEEMEVEIDRYLLVCKDRYQRNPKIKSITFAPAGKIINNCHYDEDLKEWHSRYKNNLREMLSHYIRKRDDPGFEFRKSFLDSLGFEPCKGCCETLPF